MTGATRSTVHQHRTPNMHTSHSNPAFHESIGQRNIPPSVASPTARNDAPVAGSLHVSHNQDHVYVNEDGIHHVYDKLNVLNNTNNSNILHNEDAFYEHLQR